MMFFCQKVPLAAVGAESPVVINIALLLELAAELSIPHNWPMSNYLWGALSRLCMVWGVERSAYIVRNAPSDFRMES